MVADPKSDNPAARLLDWNVVAVGTEPLPPAEIIDRQFPEFVDTLLRLKDAGIIDRNEVRLALRKWGMELDIPA